MANESTITLPSLLPTYESLYGEEGKFPVDPDTVARLRAEAEEQGLIFRGDATAGQKLSEFIRNAPDAAYSFLARGAEGTAELAAGLALLTYKGGRLATETDPEKLKKIMAEPSFTKYLGEFKGALGDLNLGENRLSGGSFEDMMGSIGYNVAPVPMLPVVKGAGQIAKGLASTQIGKNIADELGTAVTYFPQYTPFKGAQTKSVGAMSVDDSAKVVNKLPQKEVKIRGDGEPDLSKMETVGEDGKIYVNINDKAVLKDDVVLNTSVDSSGRTRYTYSLKSGVGKFLSPEQDNFLLRVLRKRLDEGQAYNTARGSLKEYISENPNLLKEAEELNILNFSGTKLQDRLSKILNKQILFRKGQAKETNNLIEEILKFKPLNKREQSVFFDYLRGNKTINGIVSADKNIDKGSLYRYLDFIRKSSPETQRAVDGKFEKFIKEFDLEIKDLKNADSIFYKQYQFFKQFDKTRVEAGKKINPFLNKIFPSKTNNPAQNSLQIAHRFENKQIGKTVGKGLEGTGGTPSAYYLDISKFNQGIQPKLEESLRIALSKNDVPALKKLNKKLTDMGAEVTVNGVKFGKHRTVEEKILKELKKYESSPELMQKMGITREMIDDVYEGLDIISQGAGKLKIKAMAGGGLATIEYMTRPLP